MVRINSEYSFDNDGRCLALYRTETRQKKGFGGNRTNTTGEIKEFKIVVGYYKNIEQLVLAAADDIVARKCNDNTITHISEYLAEYRKAVEELKAAINKQDAPESHED